MRKLIPLALITLLLTGCPPGGANNLPTWVPPFDPGNVPNTSVRQPQVLDKLGIAGATSLFVAGNPRSQYRVASTEGMDLYRSNADGSVEKVKASTVEGDPIEGLAPDHLIPVDQDYLYLGTALGQYLVRLSDGKSARIEPHSLDYGLHEWQRPVAGDSRGNVYYVHGQVLKRVQLPGAGTAPVNGDVLVKTELSNKSFEKVVSAPLVDADGNVLVSVEASAVRTYKFRIYKASGGVQDLFEANSDAAWVGPDGKFYAISSLGSKHAWGLFQLTVTPAGDIVETPVDFVPNLNSSNFGIWQPINLKERTVSSYGMTNQLVVFKGLESTRVTFPEFERVERLHPAGEAVIVLGMDASGNTPLIRYLPESGEKQVLFDGRDYQVLKVAPSPGGDLILSVLKYADITYAVGSLKPDGSLEFLKGSLPAIKTILPLR
jgi:hypothetical protein